MSEEFYTLAIQGHRPNTLYSYDYDSFVWDKFDEFILEYLRSMFREVRDQGKKLRVLTGGALGVDQKAALAVIKLKELGYPIVNGIYLPCDNYWTAWPISSQERIKEIISNTDIVKTMYTEYTDGCLEERSRVMVDDSECLLSFISVLASGTGRTMRYARKRGLIVVNIDPYTFEERTDF